MIGDPLIDTLVSAAQQREAAPSGEVAGDGLVERAARRRQQQQRPRGIGRLEAREQRSGRHHHPGASAERRVVDRTVVPGTEVTRTVHLNVEQPAVTRATEQRHPQWALEVLGKDCEDVDAHRSRAQRSKRPSGGSTTRVASRRSTTNASGTRAPESSTSRSCAGLASTLTTAPYVWPVVSTTDEPMRSCTQNSPSSSAALAPRGAAVRVTPRRASAASRSSTPSKRTSQRSRWRRALATTNWRSPAWRIAPGAVRSGRLLTNAMLTSPRTPC